MSWTAVICHGRASDRIREVDYKKSVFIDIDEATKPDQRLDISKEIIKPIHRFNQVIFVYCPLQMYMVPTKFSSNGLITSANLVDKVFINVKNMLAHDGQLYIDPGLFKEDQKGYLSEDIENQISMVSRQGFVYEGIKFLTIERNEGGEEVYEDKARFLVFRVAKN